MSLPVLSEPYPASQTSLDDRNHPRRPRQSRVWGSRIAAVVGWVWRLALGALLCMNIVTSILVVGWTYRWMQALVLRGWWKQSRFREKGTFEDFLAAFGPDAPVARPRWILREHIRESVRRRGPNGQRRGIIRVAFRLLSVPCHSFWVNLRVGLPALVCTFLVTEWGCLLMVFSWEFGWLNSWTKGYEFAAIGPVTGIVGVGLFIAAMFYVPMAQVHQAVTGQARAFFDFRLVCRLIRARLTGYVILASLFLIAGAVVQILKTAPVAFPQINPALETASDEEVRKVLQDYLIACCFVVFPMLLILRWVAAVVYRSAVLKALRRGWLQPAELPPVIDEWLQRLDLDVHVVTERRGFAWPLRLTSRPVYRTMLYLVLAQIWLVFAAQVYVGEFFNAHPVPPVLNLRDPYGNTHPFVGLANHPLVQVPCLDFVPKHLKQ